MTCDEWFADAQIPEGLPEPHDDVPYRWAKHGWEGAFEEVFTAITELSLVKIDAAPKPGDRYTYGFIDGILWFKDELKKRQIR